MMRVSQREDNGRVVIALANSERILVQVQVDPSVLSYRGVYKTEKGQKGPGAKNRSKRSAVENEKKRPIKKKQAQTKKRGHGVPLKPSKSPRASKSSKPDRDDSAPILQKRTVVDTIPEEQGHASDRTPTDRTPIRSNLLIDYPDKGNMTYSPSGHGESATMIGSMLSYSSHSGSAADDDSTRSPKDLFRVVPVISTPTSPTNTTSRQRTVTMGSSSPQKTLETEAIPQWETRRQNMLESQKNASGTSFTESKQEIGHDENIDNPAEFGAFNLDHFNSDDVSVLSESQQKRLQQRQLRLDRQKHEYDESFRSTRSIRSTTSSDAPKDGANDKSRNKSPPPKKTGRIMGNTHTFSIQKKQIEPMVVENKRTHHKHKSKNRVARVSGRSRSRSHSRSVSPTRRGGEVPSASRDRDTTSRGRGRPHQVPRDDDDDSSTMASSRRRDRIRNTLDQVRQVDLTNRMDLPPPNPRFRASSRSSYSRTPVGNLELDDEDLTMDSNLHRPNNWFSKMYGKVLKRQKRKSHRRIIGKHVEMY